MVRVIAYPAQQILEPYEAKALPICEKVGKYFTTVVTVRKEVNEWFSVRSPVIGVYTTQISIESHKIKRSKKSWIKKLLNKLF